MTVTSEEIRDFHLTGLGLEALAPALPVLQPEMLSGVVRTPQPAGPPLRDLYATALREQRGKARERFLEQVRYCRDRIEELLALDDQRDPRVSASPGAIRDSMGFAGSFFDSGALAVALQATSSPVERMDSGHRQRCEATCETLSEALVEAGTQPDFWEFPAADGGAIEFCERQLERHAATLRALKVARLEVACAYQESVHNRMLARFTWESADAEALAAMPAVLVVDSTENLADRSLSTLGRLLRSGLPLQILLTCPPFYCGDLAFLAVSHREAFVLQSSMACPDHLAHGLMDMTHCLRPAVAVVATDDPALFHRSRTFPMYVYNPEAGEDWVDRFHLYQESLLGEDVSAVHVAALYPHLQRHFRIVPKESWNDEQVELSAYLAQYKQQPPLAIPFLWVVGQDGRQQRALITRELVRIARDRQRAWRLLTELAEAGKPAPPLVDVLKIRQEGADEALRRVLALLALNAGSAPPPVLGSQAAAPATAPPLDPAETINPFIESSLCTSCNDCMKVNSRMFQYNGDKQAFVADPLAGTFAELVKAAQNCPASCIHPGSPRPDDRTATPQLIARAAKFNK